MDFWHVESSQATTMSPSIIERMPPLLSIPLEIKLEIVSNLDPVALEYLRLTHTSFADIISKADVQRSRLVWTETSRSYKFPHSHYACYVCLRRLPAHSFCDDSKTGTKGNGGISMNKRFCLDCGVEKGWYPKGTAVLIRGRLRAPCQQCGYFYFGRKNELCTPDCPGNMQRKATRDIKKW